MIIYLCRHGDRMPNGSDREKPVGLTEKGHDQARRLGRWLEAREQPPAILLSSPKLRAVQTACPARDYLKLPIQVWPCLIEHDSYGPLDFNIEAVTSMSGDFSVWRGDTLLVDTPPVEAIDFAYQRAEHALKAIRGLGVQSVAIFAHDCFNSIFIWAWLERGCLTEADRYQQRNCCVNILEDGKEPVINLDPHGVW